MKKLNLLVVFQLITLALLAQSVKTPATENGFVSLFNGINQDGWEAKCLPAGREKNFWQVKNGVIECNSIGRPDHNYVWLMNKNRYSDFHLQLKFQIFKSSKGNSGVQFKGVFMRHLAYLYQNSKNETVKKIPA